MKIGEMQFYRFLGGRVCVCVCVGGGGEPYLCVEPIFFFLLLWPSYLKRILIHLIKNC